MNIANSFINGCWSRALLCERARENKNTKILIPVICLKWAYVFHRSPGVEKSRSRASGFAIIWNACRGGPEAYVRIALASRADIQRRDYHRGGHVAPTSHDHVYRRRNVLPVFFFLTRNFLIVRSVRGNTFFTFSQNIFDRRRRRLGNLDFKTNIRFLI